MTSPNAADPPRPNPANTELRNKNNPFGRGRASGCTACHVVYGKDGHNEEPVDRTVADNGRQPETDLPLGIRQDLGQHAYARRHEITRVVKTEQCGACHGFVTRVDVAMAGTYEQETDLTNLEAITTVGPIRYPTPRGTIVNLFDNLAHYKNGRLLNDGEGLSEDLNNNGELDTALEEQDENNDGILQPNEDLNKNGRFDVGVVISEDANGNGLLDIPDRVRRSDAFDGRQSRIVYGGQNGAIRLQDIHLERGFNCVDCHIQNDVHGDSNIYTRNWDAVQIECEDCHGSNDTPPTLVFSGPNGGDDMSSARYDTAFGEPWFERRGDRLFQHSRVQKGLGWFVPTLVSPRDNASAYAHRQPLETFSELDHDTEHCAPFVDENSCSAAGCAWTGAAEGATCQGYERRYAHVAEPGENGGLECYACHSSWQPNCLSCHIKMDVAKSKQEIWWGDDDVEDIFFQLFSFTRSPFYLGRAGNTERNRVAPYRSTMQVHLTVVAGGIQLAESAVFSTTENLSSLASNPYFPHTVRTQESKSCARCHTLTDDAGRIENDHLITEATGQGTGRYQNIGDWAAVGTAAGLELLDLKREAKGAVTFPGFDFSDADGGGETRRRVSFDLSINDGDSPAPGIFDLALHRGVSLANGSGDVTDVVIIGHEGGVSVVDVFGRDNNDFGIGGLRDRTVGLPPTVLARLDSTGPVKSVDIVDAAASQSTTFVALTDEELLVLDYRQALDVARATGTDGLNLLDPDAGTPQDDGEGSDGDGALDIDAAAQGMVVVGSLTHSLDAPTRARLSGRFVLVSHAQGLAVFQLADASGATRQADIDLGPPVAELVNFETSRPALDVAVFGRFAYVAVGEAGVEVFDIGPVTMPLVQRDGSPQGVSRAPVGSILAGQGQIADSRGVAMWGSRLVVADGVHGLHVVDVSVPADPRVEETIALGGAANTVVMAEVPTRTFAIVGSDAAVFAVNLTPSTDIRTQLAAAAAAPDAFRGLRLSFELADPLTPSDAKNATRQVLRFPTSAPVRAIARGLALDAIADRGGRRLRDAWASARGPSNFPPSRACAPSW